MNHRCATGPRLLPYARLLCVAAGASLAGISAFVPQTARAESAAAAASNALAPAGAALSKSASAAQSRDASSRIGSEASAPASPASAASAPPHASNAQASAPRALAAPRLPPLTEAEAADVTRRALALRTAFAQEVTRRLNVPAAERRAYGVRLQQTLDANDVGELAREYVVLVDRAPNVQAAFIYFRTTRDNAWRMIGASPVATGLPGQYDHFVTPLGVFEHTPENMDFRAEGTINENGIRGYGQRDMRIYDFGWTDATRGWGKGGVSQMRFQMHATDPDYLEPLLGIRHSKGCVRIPASLNVFLDQHGILDAEYEARAAAGDPPWVLRVHRQVTPWAGRYLVVVDSQRKTRPAWSPAPGKKARAKLPKGGDTAD
ncbi:L,D-transpeptidase [Burkholderia thailandensis]|nr:L,D-transpeptidase [Burkholderia thailandensis]MCZ2900547.1 L,D-transpeptidase [Burkholderia thailandensis]MDD1482551.1 L,D-transpeptidase [Burkholderia thailandensis]MDD1486703.1 L,D-transpeptidase [Burkholderia thailandensis]MDD1492901.1 L,D-transpeptidase [Burkholderia thailandensis]